MILVLALTLLISAQPPVITLPEADSAQASLTNEPSQSLDERLASRLADLLAESDASRAEEIASDVRSIWRQQAGPTADLLLSRAMDAMVSGDMRTAGKAYSHLRLLEPEYAEGWVASAEYAAQQSDWAFVLEALNTAVTLDPNRFDAWTMLGAALERADAREAALEAYSEALALHPHHPLAGPAHARLEDALAGRAL